MGTLPLGVDGPSLGAPGVEGAEGDPPPGVEGEPSPGVEGLEGVGLGAIGVSEPVGGTDGTSLEPGGTSVAPGGVSTSVELVGTSEGTTVGPDGTSDVPGTSVVTEGP